VADVIGTDGNDKLSGTSSGDIIQGFGGVDAMYGKAGNDAFVIRLSDFDPATKVQDVIYDFGGAGGWSASNNDFISLLGFGAGSTMTFQKYGKVDGVEHTDLQYYTIHSTDTGLDYTIFVHSLDGKLLSNVKGDYNFYG
jgi:hypothetical protein